MEIVQFLGARYMDFDTRDQNNQVKDHITGVQVFILSDVNKNNPDVIGKIPEKFFYGVNDPLYSIFREFVPGGKYSISFGRGKNPVSWDSYDKDMK